MGISEERRAEIRASRIADRVKERRDASLANKQAKDILRGDIAVYVVAGGREIFTHLGDATAMEITRAERIAARKVLSDAIELLDSAVMDELASYIERPGRKPAHRRATLRIVK